MSGKQLLYDCPRFDHCNAPICPLHDGWRKARHLRNEPVCLYLREVGKDGGLDRLRQLLPAEMVAQIERVHWQVMTRREETGPGHAELKAALVRSQRSGSKLAAAANLREPSREVATA